MHTWPEWFQVALQHIRVGLIFFGLAVQVTKQVKSKCNNFTRYPLDGSLSLSFPFTNYIKTFYGLTNDPSQEISLCIFLLSRRYLPNGSQHVSREMQLIKFLIRNGFSHHPSSNLVEVLVTFRKYPSSINYIIMAFAVTFLSLFQIQNSHSHWSTQWFSCLCWYLE